jgi:hypothetical protein
LTTTKCHHTAQGKPEQFTPKEESLFKTADNLFHGVVISALDAEYIDFYIMQAIAKELCDALDAKFGVSDAGCELYLMEQM